MKKTLMPLGMALSLLLSVNGLAQPVTSQQKMSVSERMAKARTAKAEKKTNVPTNQLDANRAPSGLKSEKATSADYKAPIDKVQKGPNGEAVHIGERGGKYYINKNGNKTYLSSNQ